MSAATCHGCGAPLPNRSRQAHERGERIAAMWRDGMTGGEIARRLGEPEGSVRIAIHRLRAKGYDLPYRRTDLADWRCECGDLNRSHEACCYRCGAGQGDA